MLTLSRTCTKQQSSFRLLVAKMHVSRGRPERFILSNNLFVCKEENYCQPPLVIKHGILGSKTNWRSIAHHLCNRGRDVITLDLRNCGDSPHSDEMTYEAMAEDVYRTIKHVLPTEFNVDLMGHSMGGKVAMLTALKHPELVSRAIVVDILPSKVVSPGAVFVRKLFDITREIKMETNAKSHAEACHDTIAQIYPRYPDMAVCNWLTTNIDWSPERGTFWKCNMDALEKSLHFTTSFPDVDCEPFTKPVLFVQGEKSRHMDLPDREEMVRRYFPNAAFTVIKGAGHWVHSDKPYDFIQAVHDFLSQPL